MTAAAILGCAGPELSRDERDFFRQARPWGFILFARNIEDPAQVRRLASDLREAVGSEAPVFTDQEGGRVQRLRAPHWREWLPPLDQAARAGEGAARSFWLRSRIIADELRAVGIDGNCAPSGDIAGEGTHPFLKNRCYGTEPAQVADIARAVAEGLLAGGVLPVAKHLPGHGRAEKDSHHALPRAEAALDTLRAWDFAPFRALSGLPLAMTAHVVFPALDPERPATLSPACIQAIRREIGFSGLLMTDDLSMEALSGTLGERAEKARKAGIDAILYCKGVPEEAEEVIAAAGLFSPEAEARAAAALARRKAAEPIDIPALEAELAALLAAGEHGRGKLG